MATEYISREAVKKAIHRDLDMQDLYLPIEFIELLDDIPTANVRPVKHGEWIVDSHGAYQLIECDQCHAQMWNHQKELPNYCYSCGSDMRKVVEIDQVKEGAE